MVAITGLFLCAASLVSLPASAMAPSKSVEEATKEAPSHIEEDMLHINGFCFKRTIKPSQNQYVCTLEHAMPVYMDGKMLEVKSSIMFFIPNEHLKKKFLQDLREIPLGWQEETQKRARKEILGRLQYEPIIGHTCCSCNQYKRHDDSEHKAMMAEMFKTVLHILAEEGYKTVKITSSLCKSPQCLSRFMNTPGSVSVFERDDERKTMTIRLPYNW